MEINLEEMLKIVSENKMLKDEVYRLKLNKSVLSNHLEKCLDAIDSDGMRGVMSMAHIHGMSYSSPIVDVDGARKALGEKDGK